VKAGRSYPASSSSVARKDFPHVDARQVGVAVDPNSAQFIANAKRNRALVSEGTQLDADQLIRCMHDA
jgi:hypothetical protein